MAEKTGSFRMPRKPGVERNNQIGHFDDMATIRELSWSLYPAPSVRGKFPTGTPNPLSVH
jgi:hypothetical protein